MQVSTLLLFMHLCVLKFISTKLHIFLHNPAELFVCMYLLTFAFSQLTINILSCPVPTGEQPGRSHSSRATCICIIIACVVVALILLVCFPCYLPGKVSDMRYLKDSMKDSSIVNGTYLIATSLHSLFMDYICTY